MKNWFQTFSKTKTISFEAQLSNFGPCPDRQFIATYIHEIEWIDESI